jgi:hypothetical protein
VFVAGSLKISPPIQGQKEFLWTPGPRRLMTKGVGWRRAPPMWLWLARELGEGSERDEALRDFCREYSADEVSRVRLYQHRLEQPLLALRGVPSRA